MRATVNLQILGFVIAICVLLIVSVGIGATLHPSVFLRPKPHGKTETFTLKGSSLSPVYFSGQVLEMQTEGGQRISRGDYIVFYHPRRSEVFAKRVIAHSGDEMKIRHGYLFVNGVLQKNSMGANYVLTDPSLEALLAMQSRVPENMLFVLGENPRGSDDSSRFTWLPEQNVIGRIITPPNTELDF